MPSKEATSIFWSTSSQARGLLDLGGLVTDLRELLDCAVIVVTEQLLRPRVAQHALAVDLKRTMSCSISARALIPHNSAHLHRRCRVPRMTARPAIRR
jgi:hypothetical protein